MADATMTRTRVPDSVLRFAEKNFRPAVVEQDLYAWWESSGFFQPSDEPKPPFTIILPPPNVTGDLHIGHGHTFTLEDVLVRWHRMLGDPTLFLPGSDHAGIIAQVVVEEELAKEGFTRQQLGRERFLREMWAWMERYKPRMYAQMRAMGWSLDWTRETFTLNPDKQRAVRAHFIRLYRGGHLYRADRIVHWCVRCQTTYSDLEAEHVERSDTLWTVRYPFADGSPGGVRIATTRPETIVADVAVAAHPDDARWKQLVGREVLVPVVQRRVPIIADAAVDPAFGTGAVKITPGHDPDDFEIGQRHHLPTITVIDTRGLMTPAAGPLAGLTREQARDDMVKRLRAAGLMEKEEPLAHAVGRHDRCKTIDEPLVLKQWWASMRRLAAPAIDAVRDGRVRIVPPHFEKIYFHWMANIRDWNISRQIWWGHEIPAWYCRDCDEVIVPDEDAPDPTRCTRCASDDIHQDPDVLDTWFSSALWPHSTLGWPERTPDLGRFYPTSVLNTAYDILFFWVARMIMMGLHNLGEVPFRVVYVNGLIRIGSEKMSKSKGNVIDPSQMVTDYGADATRFGLTAGVAPGADAQVSPAKMERAGNFVNKVWNAGRFVLGAIEEGDGLAADERPRGGLSLADRWILSRTDAAVAEADRLLGRFDVGAHAAMCERYFWGELADWYLEAAKVRLRGASRRATRATLAHVLDRALRILHPVMPFATETLAQQLWEKAPPGERAASLMVAAWPKPGERDADAEERFGLVMDMVRAIRNLRAEQGVTSGAVVEALVDGGREVLEPERELVERLARCRLAFATGEKEAGRPGEALPPARPSVEKEAGRPGEALPPARPSVEKEAGRPPFEGAVTVVRGVSVRVRLPQKEAAGPGPGSNALAPAASRDVAPRESKRVGVATGALPPGRSSRQVDRTAARSRLERELADARARLARSEELLGRESFAKRAPRDVVAKERARLEERRAQVRKLEEDLAKL